MPRRTLELTKVNQDVAYGAITLYGMAFQPFLLSIINPITWSEPHSRWFGLFRFRSPLLTESITLSFPPGTKMFQFPGCISDRLNRFGNWLLHQLGFPIRTSADQSSLPAPRRLSQVVASFIVF